MTTIVSAITGIFDSVGDWLVNAINDVSALFYVPETGLTLIGVLAIMGLAIAVVMMLINVVKSFLRFR